MNSQANAQKHLLQENRELHARLQGLMDTAVTNDAALRRVVSVSLSILQRASLPDLLHFLCEQFCGQYGVDRIAVRLTDPDHEIEHLLRVTGSSGAEFPGLLVPTSEMILSMLAEHKISQPTKTANPPLVPQAVDQPQRHAHLAEFSRERHQHFFPDADDLTSVALLPLVTANTSIGLLALGSKDRLRFAPGLSTDFLELLAALIGVSLQTQISATRLQLTGLVDPLTELFNRRYLDARLTEEIRSAAAEATALTCIVIDADHFKRINDSYGHPAGDAVLREISVRIRRSVKARDIVVRFGGEEFVVIAGTLQEDAALTVGERIRLAIAREPISLPDTSDQLTVTASIGICWMQLSAADCDVTSVASELFEHADAALYDAKHAGRNCVRTRKSRESSIS